MTILLLINLMVIVMTILLLINLMVIVVTILYDNIILLASHSTMNGHISDY